MFQPLFPTLQNLFFCIAFSFLLLVLKNFECDILVNQINNKLLEARLLLELTLTEINVGRKEVAPLLICEHLF